MTIKVLLADDSDVRRSAMRKTLEEEPRIEIVGQASTFAATMQMISDFKPEVLLLDLHMPEKREFTPDFGQISTLYRKTHSGCVIFQ
jgi:two-component system, LytTR family, response regulator